MKEILEAYGVQRWRGHHDHPVRRRCGHHGLRGLIAQVGLLLRMRPQQVASPRRKRTAAGNAFSSVTKHAGAFCVAGSVRNPMRTAGC